MSYPKRGDDASAEAVMGVLATPAAPVRGWRRMAYLAAGVVFFVLGALGAILPILPATPFLLLTSVFLLKASPRLNALLLRSRLFGPILTDWQVHGGVRRDAKVKAVVAVSLAVALTVILSGYSLLPTVVVCVLATVGVVVIWRLPAAREVEVSAVPVAVDRSTCPTDDHP